MKTKDEIRQRIRKVRLYRNDAKHFEGTEGYVFGCDGAIRALEWMLGYKQKVKFWCLRCAIPHNDLECPQCGSNKQHIVEGVKHE